MNRLPRSLLTVLLSLGTLTTAAHAAQVGLSNTQADLNRDGEVSLTELKRYNRDQRDS